MERCVGCRSAPGPVCPDCKELTVGEVVTRRWRWPPWVALAVALAIAVAMIYVLWELRGGYPSLRTSLLLFPVAYLTAWAVRRMKRPHRLKLVRDRLELTCEIGGTREYPLSAVLSDKGMVVVGPIRRRFKVGAARYDGAERFHRALRTRRSSLGYGPD